MSLSLDEIREFSLMALDQPPAVKKSEAADFAFTININSTMNYYIATLSLFNGKIDWGDGNITEHNGTSNLVSHVYSSGIYQIKIYGDLRSIKFYDSSYVSSAQALISIDKKFPSTMSSEQNYSRGFYQCSSLISIPSGLFDNCISVESFSACFSNCSSLTSIPHDLFANNSSAIYFNSCFSGCTSLTSIPYDLFDNCLAVTSFATCFSRCEAIVSVVPDLWNSHPTANGGACYRYCTHAANYSEIPSGWR